MPWERGRPRLHSFKDLSGLHPRLILTVQAGRLRSKGLNFYVAHPKRILWL